MSVWCLPYRALVLNISSSRARDVCCVSESEMLKECSQQQYMLCHIISSVQHGTVVQKLRESITCKNKGRVEVRYLVYAEQC